MALNIFVSENNLDININYCMWLFLLAVTKPGNGKELNHAGSLTIPLTVLFILLILRNLS